MTDDELRERIAILLIARDEEMTYDEARRLWTRWKLVAEGGHHGDCTNEPHTCAKCTVNKTNKQVANLITLIKEAGYVRSADYQERLNALEIRVQQIEDVLTEYRRNPPPISPYPKDNTATWIPDVEL